MNTLEDAYIAIAREEDQILYDLVNKGVRTTSLETRKLTVKQLEQIIQRNSIVEDHIQSVANNIIDD
jgi:hypothetical protein